MSLLDVHLEQIAISCVGINSLPFPRPKIFANALLSNHDITSLIRDTEAHERALFSVPPTTTNTASTPSTASTTATSEPRTSQVGAAPPKSSSRRQTVFNVSSGEVVAGPAPRTSSSATTTAHVTRRNTAVAAVLGGDLHAQLRRGEIASRRAGSGGNDDVDVDILLLGAEKLCGVYAPQGARETIADLRSRWHAAQGTMEYYESKVEEQARRLYQMRARGGDVWDEEDDEVGGGGDGQDDNREDVFTEEDLRREEEEVRELERKKRELQARLKSMGRDLGGLRA